MKIIILEHPTTVVRTERMVKLVGPDGRVIRRSNQEVLNLPDKKINHNEASASPTPKDPTPAEIILSLLRQDANGKYTNVFEVLSSVQVLKLAYETIKSKPGNMVKGVTS